VGAAADAVGAGGWTPATPPSPNDGWTRIARGGSGWREAA
jgi:hypothetical protein